MLVLSFGLVACGGGDGGGEGDTGDGADTGGDTTVVESPVDPATAGSVKGSVAFTGTAPEPEVIDMSGEPDCAAKYTDPPTSEEVVVNSNGTLKNVFVYVKTGLEGMEFPVPAEAVVLDQSGCRYHPHVVGVMVGQDFKVTNSDDLLHNIHPNPSDNRGFNESQPRAGMEFVKQFTTPEVFIPVGCDVHDWMSAHIGVVAHPYFAVTDDAGNYSLPNLPPGTYTIAAVHETYGEMTQEVTIAASEQGEANFSFDGS
jgi:hypothetical protein